MPQKAQERPQEKMCPAHRISMQAYGARSLWGEGQLSLHVHAELSSSIASKQVSGRENPSIGADVAHAIRTQSIASSRNEPLGTSAKHHVDMRTARPGVLIEQNGCHTNGARAVQTLD